MVMIERGYGQDAFKFADKHPWFDWPQWGLAIDSDHRYKPRWWERRAYYAGLRDAARIVETQHFIKTPLGRHVRRDGIRPAVKAIHAYVLDFFGLARDDRSGLE